ncbi:MAG: QueT transporter family protein [Firmicutes bacterium]|nr:QueT transporter family protein [Bacillota bacterium]
MKKTKSSALELAQGGIIAALYVVLTLVFAPISFGEAQLRVAEALTILPMFTSAAVPGLFVGCIIANMLGGAVLWDVVFGSLATLLGALGSYLLRKKRWLVPFPPIIANTMIIPFVLKFAYGIDLPIPMLMLYILLGEIGGCYVLGQLLASVLMRHKNTLFKEDLQ